MRKRLKAFCGQLPAIKLSLSIFGLIMFIAIVSLADNGKSNSGYVENCLTLNNYKATPSETQQELGDTFVPAYHIGDSAGATLEFEVYNNCDRPSRIVNIYIDVINFTPCNPNEQFTKLAVGEMREYFCIIGPNKRYDCNKRLNESTYIKMLNGELELFGINVQAKETGIYQLGIGLDYTIDNETKTIKSENSVLIAFYGITPNPEES